MTGNDDLSGIATSGLTVEIGPGEALVLVLTGFGEGPVGPYSLEVFTDAPGQRPTTGELLITEIMFDPAAVDDRVGEWFEVLNLADGDRQLAGLALHDSGGGRSVFEGDLLLPPEASAVIGLSDDPARNGGVPVDLTWSGFFLDNGDETIRLLDYDDSEVDAVRYGDGWPAEPGRSIQLSPAGSNAGENDDPALWCLGVTPLPGGDRGTPGRPNDACLE